MSKYIEVSDFILLFKFSLKESKVSFFIIIIYALCIWIQ